MLRFLLLFRFRLEWLVYHAPVDYVTLLLHGDIRVIGFCLKYGMMFPLMVKPVLMDFVFLSPRLSFQLSNVPIRKTSNHNREGSFFPLATRKFMIELCGGGKPPDRYRLKWMAFYSTGAHRRNANFRQGNVRLALLLPSQ